MASRPNRPEGRAGVSPRAALYSILGFWTFFVAIITLRGVLGDWPMQGEMFARRMVVSLAGIALHFGLYLFLERFTQRPLRTRIATVFIAAIPVAFAIAGFNYYVFNVYEPISLLPAEAEAYINAIKHVSIFDELTDAATSRYFFLLAWAALYLALGYAADVARAERRAAAYRAEAQTAQLRALRYQVNPHFLFNTLNALSSLVLARRNADAERMILNLSTFFRSSLATDPLEDVPLGEEIALQKLYLEVEKVRFPERLIVDIDVPADLESLAVPGLILQPLVENAIKYGVSPARRPVTVRIAAKRRGAELHLFVEDDGEPAPGFKPEGAGVGLRNVCDRLAARFGDSGRCDYGPRPGGGFGVHLVIPVVPDA